MVHKITFPSIQKGLWRPECQLPILERGSRGPGLLRDTLSCAVSCAQCTSRRGFVCAESALHHGPE